MGGIGLQRLTDVLDMADVLTSGRTISEPELATTLEAIYQGLFLADFSEFDIDLVKQKQAALVERIFALYLSLRDQVPGWHHDGMMSHRVQVALRNVFRAARYARDLLGEIALGHPRLAKGETPHVAFTGPEHGLLINPRLAAMPFALKPGDVLLQRGLVHNSAAISRIGDVDSQFSHLSIVARNATGEPVMVEALIEEGSVVKPLEAALAHGIGRALLFRHRDRHLAERAAEMIHDAIVRADGTNEPRILYDFSMELGGYRDLYCAKLVRLAYSMASTGDVRLPTFATRLDMKNRDFVARIGVTATDTFAPGDLELEPDFDIVAEWRDYRVTSELRLKDMIMLKLFEWMESHGYRFRPTFLVGLVGRLGVASAHMPSVVQGLMHRVAGKVPPNMTREAVGAVAMLHWTAEELYAELRRLEDATIRTTGRQLHPRLVLAELERLRTESGTQLGYLSVEPR